MRHLTVRLIVNAVILSIVGITSAALWLTHRSSSIVGTAPLEAPITCCELIQNPDRYFSKTIRVRAVLLGYHELALYDPACKGVDKYVRADFDSASRKKLVMGIADLNGVGLKEGNFWAEVVLVGRFEKVNAAEAYGNRPESQKVNHQYIKYRFRLVVLDVEHASAVASTLSWPP